MGITIFEGGNGRVVDRDLDAQLAAARDAGRGEAASWWPMVDEEGYRRGRQDERHDLARRLRRLARSDPAARSLLLALLEDDGVL